MSSAVRWEGSSSSEPFVCAAHALNGLGFNAHQTWALRRADFRAVAEAPFFLPSGERMTMGHIRVLPEEEYGARRMNIILGHLLGGWPQWLYG
ncbi:MAG TPA: hypothetical protein RMH99_28745, partial [Sandaracinaceae bacterium LLY-WYZ-13_1]|nr:hypothetical protein [Sandaracinaceae bacterium LLY-WYZ-13_1]